MPQVADWNDIKDKKCYCLLDDYSTTKDRQLQVTTDGLNLTATLVETP